MDEARLNLMFFKCITVAWSFLGLENSHKSCSFGDALLKYHSAGAIKRDYLPLVNIILSLIRVHLVEAVYFIAYGI